MATTILLARHGETDWNREQRFQGHADPPLNARGREQARGLAEELAADRPAAIYCSDLRRAHEAARVGRANPRLGETEWTGEQRFQGPATPPLNARGREQARGLAEELAADRPAAIYCSDLRRAHETARIVGENLGVDVTVLPALREVDVGSWS